MINLHVPLTKDERAKDGNIPQISALSEKGDYSKRKYFYFFSLRSIDVKIFSVHTDEFRTIKCRVMFVTTKT